MARPDKLSLWKQEVSTAFIHLSKTQMLGLVYWSVGIALIGSGGIRQISALLAQIMNQKEGTVFQRLREWYLDAKHKSGDHRRELDVTSCFGPLFRWIIRLWAGSERRIALALDATTLGDRWTVLAICVDRKSTRLNSSHGYISYAVFCLKKKKNAMHPAVT